MKFTVHKALSSVVMLFLAFSLYSCSGAKSASGTLAGTPKSEIIEIIKKVNNYWQESNPKHGDAFWNRAAYHTGNMAAYQVTKEQTFLDYSIACSFSLYFFILLSFLRFLFLSFWKRPSHIRHFRS